MNIFNKKLKSTEGSLLPIEPIELYQSCQYKEGYAYLRGIQEEVLRSWHLIRDQRDVICKMNTGSGKTLTALLMLYSKMLELKKPVVYLCPDKQLVSQTLFQANQYGIPVCESSSGHNLPIDFLNSKKILVCTFQKLFNGKSVFERDEIDLAAIVIDDAHRCVDIARSQTSLTLSRDHKIAESLFRLFTDSLQHQVPGTFRRLADGDPYVVTKVPYWTWMDNQNKILEVIGDYIKDNSREPLDASDSLSFKWNYLADNLLSYDCFISGHTLEINPIQTPYYLMRSFNEADHRFILSATFEDDFDLIRDLGIDINSIENPIVPRDRKDVGKRLILAPNRHDPHITDARLRGFIADYSQEGVNVVVLCPSLQKAKEWVKRGAILVDRDNIEDALTDLKDSRGKFMVFANRYEGMDLNASLCRVLVIDGLPISGSAQDMFMESRLDIFKAGRKAQVIEQGLGRAVRSGSDFCVVFLMGADLINFIGTEKNLKHFTPVTRAQLNMGLSLLDQEQTDDMLDLIKDTANLCLSQHQDWLQFHAQELLGIELDLFDERKKLMWNIADTEREALNLFRKRNQLDASNLVLDKIVSADNVNDKEKGWYCQFAAQLVYQKDKDQSNKLQIKAGSFANNMFHPIMGSVDFKKLRKKNDQAALVSKNIGEFERSQDIAVYVNSILNGLQYIPEVDSNIFEENLYILGDFLGFTAQRPEKDLGNGPDVLWCLSDGKYLILEAKSESTHDAISRDNMKQLYHSIEWFKLQYGESADYLGITLQAPQRKEPTVVINDDVRVIDIRALKDLKENLLQFSSALQDVNPKSHRIEKISSLLELHHFTPALFVRKYLNRIK